MSPKANKLKINFYLVFGIPDKTKTDDDDDDDDDGVIS